MRYGLADPHIIQTTIILTMMLKKGNTKFANTFSQHKGIPDSLYRPFLVQYLCAPTQDIVPKLHTPLSSEAI
jgi:hypothetical protein